MKTWHIASHTGGSSPLTRGKLIALNLSKSVSGLIPAHAGKTAQSPDLQAASAAHPRSRGENLGLRHARVEMEGSSPLTRGKPSIPPAFSSRPRLIPAHAGKTMSSPGSIRVPWAHPRSRGENSSEAGDEKGSTGSSPLTRGKPSRAIQARARDGLIPAHAGKTAPNGIKNFADGAHPRSRGENYAPERPTVGRRGSSPLTRGKRAEDVNANFAERLIPAHAGKTRDSRAMWPGPTAHPRSRGENKHYTRGQFTITGSSPLTRGKLVDDGCEVVADGLIPAHAGKTRRN